LSGQLASVQAQLQMVMALLVKQQTSGGSLQGGEVERLQKQMAHLQPQGSLAGAIMGAGVGGSGGGGGGGRGKAKAAAAAAEEEGSDDDEYGAKKRSGGARGAAAKRGGGAAGGSGRRQRGAPVSASELGTDALLPPLSEAEMQAMVADVESLNDDQMGRLMQALQDCNVVKPGEEELELDKMSPAEVRCVVWAAPLAPTTAPPQRQPLTPFPPTPAAKSRRKWTA
jgi:hypothetical protein